MPIENEFKYLMSLDLKQELFSNNPLKIKQSYLGLDPQTRIRNINGEYFLTVKKQLDELYEFEIPISIEEGEKLYNNGFYNIHKYRYRCGAWEIDFIYKKDIYCVIVEIETPLKIRPTLPDFLLPYLVYEIPQKDQNFVNFMLSDEKYVKGLYDSFQS